MSTGPVSGGVNRATFVARLSAALGRRAVAAPPTAAPMIDDAIARVTWAGEDLVAIFAARATDAGMVVHRAPAAGLSECLERLLAKLGAKRVVVAGVPSLGGAAASMKARGVEVVPLSRDSGLEPLYRVDAGVTDVQGAIAETGTLVCWSGSGRGLSLVPPVHIAVVRRSDIIPDLIDYLVRHAQHGPEDLPSSIVFITGPSKTADIEGVLITGVHGPREVHILLMDDA